MPDNENNKNNETNVDKFMREVREFLIAKDAPQQIVSWMIPKDLKNLFPGSIFDFFKEDIEETPEDTEAQWIYKSARRNFVLTLRRSFAIRHLDPLRAYVLTKNTDLGFIKSKDYYV